MRPPCAAGTAGKSNLVVLEFESSGRDSTLVLRRGDVLSCIDADFSKPSIVGKLSSEIYGIPRDRLLARLRKRILFLRPGFQNPERFLAVQTFRILEFQSPARMSIHPHLLDHIYVYYRYERELCVLSVLP